METKLSRRNTLRLGLAAVAGAAAGHSLRPRTALAMTKTLSIAMPEKLAGTRLSPTSVKLDAASATNARKALAPAVATLAKSAGLELTTAQVDELQREFVDRGSILIGQGESAKITISTIEWRPGTTAAQAGKTKAW